MLDLIISRDFFFDNDKIVHTLYEDVEGLVIGANVTINGLNVGKVKIIDFNENYDKIKVTFSIRQDLAFSKTVQPNYMRLD